MIIIIENEGRTSMAVREELQITGLSCEGCVETVSERLAALPGVTQVSVELSPGGVSTASVDSAGPLDRALVQRVLSDDSGFRLS